MRGFRALLAVILPMLLAAVAVAKIPSDEPPLDVIGRWAPGAPSALALDGGIAYVGHGARLEAVYVGRPESPKRLGYVDFPVMVIDLATQGRYVYVTTRDGAFSVVDAREPNRLRVVARLEATERVFYSRLELAGDLVYCAGATLSIIDIGTPAAPRVLGTAPIQWCIDVAAEGNRLYVVTDDGVNILDASDPRAPDPLEIIPTRDMMTQVAWVQVHGGLVYIGSYDAVAAFRVDATASAHPSVWRIENGWTTALAFRDSEIYAAGRTAARYQGLADVPDWIESGLGGATAVAVEGNTLVVAYASSGLATYALRDSAEPRRLSLVETGVSAENVATEGTRAWLACGRGGVRLLDLSNPASPRQIGSLATTLGPPGTRMWARSIVPRGNRAVVLGTGDAAMMVVEAVPDGALREVFRAPPAADGHVHSFAAAVPTRDGWIAWGEDGVYGLLIDPVGGVNMAPITWPIDLGIAASAGNDLQYAFGDQGRLCLLSATAGGALQRLGSVFLNGASLDISSAANGLVWLVEFYSLRVVDISDPANPRMRGLASLPPISRPGQIDAVSAAGTVACGLGLYEGIVIAEAANPDVPTLHCFADYMDSPVAIAALGDMACMVDVTGTMTIVRPRPATVAAAPLAPAQVARLVVAPNPCNPRATITFTMADASPATVRVFDARGRLVRQLQDGWLDTGTHDVPWSGDDDNGRPVAAGVYLVRATTNGHADVARVTVVK